MGQVKKTFGAKAVISPKLKEHLGDHEEDWISEQFISKVTPLLARIKSSRGSYYQDRTVYTMTTTRTEYYTDNNKRSYEPSELASYNNLEEKKKWKSTLTRVIVWNVDLVLEEGLQLMD